jgi:hypothetical protein
MSFMRLPCPITVPGVEKCSLRYDGSQHVLL